MPRRFQFKIIESPYFPTEKNGNFLFFIFYLFVLVLSKMAASSSGSSRYRRVSVARERYLTRFGSQAPYADSYIPKPFLPKELRELKALDTCLSSEAVFTAFNQALFFTKPGTFQCLSLVPPGFSFYQRIGPSIIVDRLDFQFFIRPPSVVPIVVSAGPDVLRIVFLFDAYPKKAYPASTDVFQMTVQSGATILNPVYQFPNPDFIERFTILKDIVLSVPHFDGTQFNPTVDQGFRLDHRGSISSVRGLRLTFDASTAYTPSSNPMLMERVRNGAIHIFCCSLNGDATHGFGVIGSSRLWFRDA